MTDSPECSDPDREKAEDQIQATIGYVYAETILIALLPVVYGLFTFVYGDELWLGQMISRTDIYQAAYELPEAPESWGTVFFIGGLAIMFFNLRRTWELWTAIFCMATAFCFMFFAISFLIDVFDNDAKNGLPAVLAYGVLSACLVNRARLAWKWKN